MGFKHKAMVNPPLPQVVMNRYFPSEAVKFPIMQVGQGVFATNVNAATYEWNKFKDQILKGMGAITKHYPRSMKLRPTQIELRYLNLFDKKYLSSEKNVSFLAFMNKEANASLTLPKFSFAKKLKANEVGRLIVSNEVSGMPALTKFSFDLGSVKQEGALDHMIRLESKITSGDTKKALTVNGKLAPYISKWLEDARTILSPFFREFLTPALHDTLKG